MKHSVPVTFLLLGLFLAAQLIGLLVVNAYIDHAAAEKGEESFTDLPFNVERPQLEQKTSFIYIFIAILIGTGLVLLIIKYGQMTLWKVWFFFGVTVTLVIAFAAFLPQLLAGVLGIAFAAWKTFKPNPYVHNATELFIYGGLAAIFVPLLSVWSILFLLLLVSAYDAYAVWKSKHMITMATFQTKTNMFAGLLVGYKQKKKDVKKTTVPVPLKEVRTAVLGGGDIGFPLLFAGVVFKGLLLQYSFLLSFLLTTIMSVAATIALLLLFLYAEKDKFYPAMPFITTGCLVGYGLIYSITFFL